MNPKKPVPLEYVSETMMLAFVDGDDSIEPTPMYDLNAHRKHALWVAERYMRWAKMCQELLDLGPTSAKK
jgi:hypothetical protein